MTGLTKQTEDKTYYMIGQILDANMDTINGVLLTDASTGTNIRATVLEAQELYKQGRVDLPPY